MTAKKDARIAALIFQAEIGQRAAAPSNGALRKALLWKPAFTRLSGHHKMRPSKNGQMQKTAQQNAEQRAFDRRHGKR